jgi:hypothetical protein
MKKKGSLFFTGFVGWWPYTLGTHVTVKASPAKSSPIKQFSGKKDYLFLRTSWPGAFRSA